MRVSLQDDPRFVALIGGDVVDAVELEQVWESEPPASSYGGMQAAPNPAEIEQMAQYAAERLQGIAMEMAPGIERRVQMLIGEAMRHFEEVMGEFQMRMSEDPELMEDLLVAAVNEAGRKVDEELERVTRGMTGGLNIPGLT